MDIVQINTLLVDNLDILELAEVISNKNSKDSTGYMTTITSLNRIRLGSVIRFARDHSCLSSDTYISFEGVKPYLLMDKSELALHVTPDPYRIIAARLELGK
jgi:hypothetical protein